MEAISPAPGSTTRRRSAPEDQVFDQSEENMMNRRSILSIFAVTLCGVTFAAGNAVAQKASEMDAVKAANQAFYTALSARDVGAMQKVWSGDADIQNIGPRSKAADVGWNAMKKGFEAVFDNFPELKVSMEQPRIKINGSTAWVSGIEKAQRKNKSGEASSGANLGPSIFVKQGGRWLMVYHHASAMPQ
jgi:ketosteroid isomerase-like protein